MIFGKGWPDVIVVRSGDADHSVSCYGYLCNCRNQFCFADQEACFFDATDVHDMEGKIHGRVNMSGIRKWYMPLVGKGGL